MTEPSPANERRKLFIGRDVAEAAQLAAATFVASAEQAIASRGRCCVALAGGSTPATLYALLASPEWSQRLPWDGIHFFWGDERFLPPDDANSNYRMVNEALLSKTAIPPSNVHRVMTELGSPAEVAARYEQTIRDFVPARNGATPALDIAILGLGINGHTASLFPCRPTLHIADRLVVADYIAELSSPRITMTAPLLNESAFTLFFVTGAEKAQVVHDVLLGPSDPERLPAQLIAPCVGALIWILDQAAASRLPETHPWSS